MISKVERRMETGPMRTKLVIRNLSNTNTVTGSRILNNTELRPSSAI